MDKKAKKKIEVLRDRHPHLYDPDRRMVKPPVVQAAGMLRAVGRGIDTDAWSWLCDQAGQMLFEPPNVSGWDDTRWLDTATFRARWQMASEICNKAQLGEKAKVSANPRKLVAGAAHFWQTPLVARDPRGARALRPQRDGVRHADWERDTYPRLTENALRMLVAVSPDYLTSEHPRLPHLLRRARPRRPRRRRPAGDRGRGCRRPPAPACRGDRSCCARPGSRCRCTAPASSPGCRCSRRASRAPRRPAGHGPGQRVPRRRRRQPVDPRPDRRPDYRRLRPNLALPDGARRLRRGRAADLASDRDAAGADLHAEGKVSVLPAVGYDHPDQSHFVSRHFWEVGAPDAGLRYGLDGPAARPHRHRRQPAPGRVARRQPRPVARRRARAGRGGRRAGGRSASGCPARGARPPTSS